MLKAVCNFLNLNAKPNLLLDLNLIHHCDQIPIVSEQMWKRILLRQKYIFEAIVENKQLCTYALKGVRMVCLPKSAPKYLSKCIYIEAVSNREIKHFLERKLKFKIHRIIYKSDQRTVQSERTGDTATFRHMFEIVNNEIGKSYLVAIENVSDDYGGRLRIKHYLSCVRDWVCEGEHREAIFVLQIMISLFLVLNRGKGFK